MEKGHNFNQFSDKVIDYQKRKLLLIVNKEEKDHKGKFSNEYKTLAKAKKDIRDKAKNILDGTLTFSEIISYGELSKNAREQWPRTSELSLDSRLKDYIFRDEKDEIKALSYHQTQEFVMDVFDKNMIKRLLDNLFFYGYSRSLLNKFS